MAPAEPAGVAGRATRAPLCGEMGILASQEATAPVVHLVVTLEAVVPEGRL
jgi:hypothetical protein